MGPGRAQPGRACSGKGRRCTTAPSLAPHPRGSSLPISWALPGSCARLGLPRDLGSSRAPLRHPMGFFQTCFHTPSPGSKGGCRDAGGARGPVGGCLSPGTISRLSQFGGRLKQRLPKGGSKSSPLRRTVLLGHCGWHRPWAASTGVSGGSGVSHSRNGLQREQSGQDEPTLPAGGPGPERAGASLA